jgi:hypothetical protein
MVWLDGARPPPFKSNKEFGKFIIQQTRNLHIYPLMILHYETLIKRVILNKSSLLLKIDLRKTQTLQQNW